MNFKVTRVFESFGHVCVEVKYGDDNNTTIDLSVNYDDPTRTPSLIMDAKKKYALIKERERLHLEQERRTREAMKHAKKLLGKEFNFEVP